MTLVQSVKKTAKSAGLVLMTGAFCIFAPPQPASAATPVSSCGAVLSLPGEYILTNDLNNCPSTAVTITASDVHFNLDGHTIDGIGNGSGIAVGAVGLTCVATSNVHINNGTVTQFDDGIQLCRATDAHVNNVTATQNDNGDHGIEVNDGANDNLLQANSSTGNGTVDMVDFNPACDANTWKANHFNTANQPCIQ